MIEANAHIFQRGEPATLLLDVDGNPTGYTCVAKLKLAERFSQNPPSPTTPVAAVFATTFVTASAPDPAYWLLTLSPALTLALEAGRYIADATIALAGVTVAITDPVTLILKDSVSS